MSGRERKGREGGREGGRGEEGGDGWVGGEEGVLITINMFHHQMLKRAVTEREL